MNAKKQSINLLLRCIGVLGFLTLSECIKYGKHYPNGEEAVEYIYSKDGMWKYMNPAEYKWNYYNYLSNPPNHPYDKSALIAYADGTHFSTCLDANKHLLLDPKHTGEISIKEGWAFHEHNGRGKEGEKKGKPFTQFWFDDNSLAIYMSLAYEREAPQGLSVYKEFTRWVVLDWDIEYWTPYPPNNYIDQIALNGICYLALHQTQLSYSHWSKILSISSYKYIPSEQQYIYPDIKENYHLGLFQILTSMLLDSYLSRGHIILQHWVSLRSNILNNQERNKTTSLGWISNIGNENSLINTESIAVNVLALSTNSIHVFEAGKEPLKMESKKYFLRPYNALSAVVGTIYIYIYRSIISWIYDTRSQLELSSRKISSTIST